jgi:hypothetical protein
MWSSYRSYASNEEGTVKVNQWPAAELRAHPAAQAEPYRRKWEDPSFAKNAKDGPPAVSLSEAVSG